MKIFVNFTPLNHAWGGANQFFKGLLNFFASKNLLTTDPLKCDIFLFNSHHHLEDIWKIKRLNPKIKFVSRVDGPISLVRGNDTETDQKIFYYNNLYADGTIFQSQFSKKETIRLKYKFKNPHTIIPNAVDGNIFFPPKEKPQNQKIKIIASSWSDNPRKGLDFYRFLDGNLDFNRYDFVFVGRIKHQFENASYISPETSQNLAGRLQSADIYLTGSENDPCSNSLTEALACGLPAVYLNSGGHPEIVKNAGLPFSNKEDLLKTIDDVSKKKEFFTSQIEIAKMEEIGERYIQFFKEILGK